MPLLLGRYKGGWYKFAMKVLSRFTLDFLKTETGAGTLLGVLAALAIAWANSPWAGAYFALVHYPLPADIGPWHLRWPAAEWVKEGLKAIFFFIVGLEIKYEMFRGELSNPKTLALPVAAAFGGMVVPALVYLALNMSGGDPRGWSVPVATDIAFALAVLAVVGKGLPPSLRVFLLTLAIVDDLGAVILIGVFYNTRFDGLYLGLMAALLTVTALVRFVPGTRRGLGWIYCALFLAVWAVSLKAGISPSLAAVATAFCVPIDAGSRTGIVKMLVHGLHPYVAYIVLPLFAFTAAGFSFAAVHATGLPDPRFLGVTLRVTLGVTLGLFLGKQIGVFGAAWAAIRLNLGRMPEGATTGQLYGVCLLCGIGFTMSLFLAAMAFPQSDKIAEIAVKMGVAAGSILSACAGAIFLLFAKKARKILR